MEGKRFPLIGPGLGRRVESAGGLAIEAADEACNRETIGWFRFDHPRAGTGARATMKSGISKHVFGPNVGDILLPPGLGVVAMSKRCLRCLAALTVAIGCWLAPSLVSAGEGGVVTVVASGFTSEKGMVLVALCNSREDYESDEECFRVGRVRAKDGQATHRFEEVPDGTYAVKLFHDENSNDELDMGWMGAEERYGISNDARGLLGPPDWDEARFSFDGPEQTLKIKVE